MVGSQGQTQGVSSSLSPSKISRKQSDHHIIICANEKDASNDWEETPSNWKHKPVLGYLVSFVLILCLASFDF